jgi:hypothetical protein
MLAALVQARMVAGEAALRGLTADPDEVAAAAARWRAVTTCTPTRARELPDLCSNHQEPKDECRWFGVGVLCPLRHDARIAEAVRR